MKKYIPLFLTLLLAFTSAAQQQLTDYVNVFLGTSGDHGQMSPSATTPFNMMNLGPQPIRISIRAMNITQSSLTVLPIPEWKAWAAREAEEIYLLNLF